MALMIFSGIIAGKNNSYSGINDDDLHVAIDNDLVSGTLTREPKELLTAAQSRVYNILLLISLSQTSTSLPIPSSF